MLPRCRIAGAAFTVGRDPPSPAGAGGRADPRPRTRTSMLPWNSRRTRRTDRSWSSMRRTPTSTPSTGRYRPFAELLRNDGYSVVAGKSPIDRDGLDATDVLVISNALPPPGAAPGTPAFTERESDAIEDWVREEVDPSC